MENRFGDKRVLGLIPLFGLLLLALMLHQPRVETDLAARSSALATALEAPWAKIGIAGRDATVTGKAETPEAQAALVARLDQTFGIRQIHDQSGLIDEAKPYTLAVTREGNRLVVSGHAPTSKAKAAMLASAKATFPAGDVIDQVKIARGAPAASFAPTTTLLLGALQKLDPGTFSLSDTVVKISGKGRDLVTEEEIRTDLKAMAAPFTLVEAKIDSRVIKPYRFEAVRASGALTLLGYLPNDAMRADLVAHARRYFGTAHIEAKTLEGLGEPKNLAPALKAGLQALARLGPGASLRLSDTVLVLKGEALYAQAHKEITDYFTKALPQGFSPQLELSLAPPPPDLHESTACQSRYREELARGTILFQTGSADLSDESRGLLDQLTVVALQCRGFMLEIGGHTDADGAPEANAALSRLRAEAVAGYLVRAGVLPARLSPVGYGAQVPVAPNDTAENKAKNRRIDFIVK